MIKAKIILQAFPDNWFHIMVKDVSFNSFNKNFRNMSATHWKTVQIKDGWSEADPSSLPSLQIPIKFTMRNGILSDIIVSTSEPEWVLNFKKALVSLFKVQEDQNNLNKPGTQHTWKCSKGNCTPNWQRNFQVKYINCGKS